MDVEPVLDDGRKELVCKKCGKSFFAYGQQIRKKYCSDECRCAAAKEAYRAKHPPKMVPCVVCGAPVDTFHGRKYCSGACKVRACREQNEAVKARKKQNREEGNE